MKNPPPDLTVWLAETTTVTPLGQKAKSTNPPKPSEYPSQLAPELTESQKQAQQRAIRGWNHTNPIPITHNTANLIAGHTPGMDKNILKQLSQGELRPTAVLDLHGLGEGDAWLELMDFLHEAIRQDHRTCLIIHGKGTGYGPHKNMGVIKFQMATWLAGHPQTLAFHTAQPFDGGTGAIYVYLKQPL
ncbi:MAG: hypothetical protein EBQ80_01845 [Proteobacteria bacterium]|nr:hypothetical protein [Bacteroidota bacterium]NBX85978.1 hypothetical protein [Pseudomonadota bacterium]